jgi:hypothetical protein
LFRLYSGIQAEQALGGFQLPSDTLLLPCPWNLAYQAHSFQGIFVAAFLKFLRSAHDFHPLSAFNSIFIFPLESKLSRAFSISSREAFQIG